jgi:hypothetical protein
MDPQNPESTDTRAAHSESGQERQPSAVGSAGEQQELDAAALVDEMVKSGAWPAPELLERIVAAGEAAVDPLIAILRTRPPGCPDDAPLSHAIGLLSMLRPPAAIQELVAVARRCDEDIAQDAANALVAYGPAGCDALIELCAEPSVGGYSRALIADAAVGAALLDPVRRSRLAEVLRTHLEAGINNAREELRTTGFLEKNRPDGADYADEFDDWDDDFLDEDDELFDEYYDPDEAELPNEAGVALDPAQRKRERSESVETPEDEEPRIIKLHEDDGLEPEKLEDDLTAGDEEEDPLFIEPLNSEEVAFYVESLADLADPSALPLIEAAFREGLVDESIADRASVDERYAAGGKASEADVDWLSSYGADYEVYRDDSSRGSTRSRPGFVRPERFDDDDYGYEGDDPSPVPPPAVPFRNAGPKLGRNDPCWCGSGKKYKKCHLRNDTLA